MSKGGNNGGNRGGTSSGGKGSGNASSGRGRGQGNAGGWPSTVPYHESGGGRSNAAPKSQGKK